MTTTAATQAMAIHIQVRPGGGACRAGAPVSAGPTVAASPMLSRGW